MFVADVEYREISADGLLRHPEKGRFPRGRAEIPDEAIAYLARQIGVERTEIAF